jgi:uncharacterized protein (TIGR02453 family)
MSYFTPASLRFFRGLAKNNRKEWFEAHRAEYESQVKEPMAELVREMDLRMSKFAPEMVGDPKRSMFRLNRDVRFSSDKSPYKTHAACWFFHGDGSSKVGKEAHGGGAGFYFHLQPGACFAGGGLWMPPRPALQRLRAAMAADPRGFEKLVLAPKLLKRLRGLSEEALLKRMPRGYDEGHPAARWLRYQSFTVGRTVTDAEATSGRLTAALETDFTVTLPLVRWINGVLGLKAASRR